MTEQIAQERQMSGLLYVGTALTGLVDAISYIGLGHVFTANMTGNIVLLGFAVAGTAGLSVLRSLAALTAFMAGASIGGRMAATLEPQSIRRWRMTAVAIESAFLLAATLAALDHPLPFNDSIRLYAAIIFTALAMGMRNATVRKIGQPDLTTTVLTLTITGLAADSSVAGGNNPRWQRRVLSVVLMFSGAAAGALLVKHSLALPLAVATIATACVAISIYRTSEESAGRTETQGSGSSSNKFHFRAAWGLIMKGIKNFRRAAGATGAAIAGTGFFFAIIGVFGLGFAIAGLFVFVVIAAIAYSAFPGDEVDV